MMIKDMVNVKVRVVGGREVESWFNYADRAGAYCDGFEEATLALGYLVEYMKINDESLSLRRK